MKFFSSQRFTKQDLPKIGVGAMPFGDGSADPANAEAVWHHAFDLGMTLINTADCYSPSAEAFGLNEIQVGDAVRSYAGGRDSITVVTKNGIRRDGNEWSRDNSYDYMLSAAEASYNRLGFAPDVLCLHRRNREQPIADATRALVAAREQGLTHSIGMSNITPEEFRIVWEVSEGTLAFVENERSPRYRDNTEVLDLCTENDIVFLAWSPLGGARMASDMRGQSPALLEVASRHTVGGQPATPQQVALAWLLTHSPMMLPIPAFTRLATADSSAAAVELALTEEDLEQLNSDNYLDSSNFPD